MLLSPGALHCRILVGNPHPRGHSQAKKINAKFLSSHRKNCKELLHCFLLSYQSVATEGRDQLLREGRAGG